MKSSKICEILDKNDKREFHLKVLISLIENVFIVLEKIVDNLKKKNNVVNNSRT